jgi:small-conductance mechanosensitive channel/CRP-like cAMP-binding protein
MDKYLDLLADTSFAFGGIGVVIVTIMVALLFVLMPRELRGKVRLPALLLVAHVVLYLVHRQTSSHAIRRPIELLGLFLLLMCFGRSAFLLVFEWLFHYRLGRPASRIVADIVQVLIYVGVALVLFREMGAELGSILTTSAVLTAIIGLSLQETLGNLFAGLAIQAQRPFEVGDWIQMAGSEEGTGKVTEINWRATRLLTNEGVEVTVPNGLLAKSPIRNFTKPSPISRREVRVQGPYDIAPHCVEAALLQAAVACPGVLEQPAPSIWVTQYADSGIEYAILYFISEFASRGQIDAEVRRRVWYAMRRAAIGIPYPIREVHLRRSSESVTEALELEQSQLRLRLMKSVDFLAGLPQAALQQLAQGSRLCFYSRGEDIVRQGEPGSDLFIIKSGEAAVIVKQEQNEPVEVARLGPGAFFGEMSLVTGAPRTATVRTPNVCEVLIIGHNEFADVLEHYPEIAQRISEALASRQAELEQVQVVGEQKTPRPDSGELLNKIRRFFSL